MVLEQIANGWSTAIDLVLALVCGLRTISYPSLSEAMEVDTVELSSHQYEDDYNMDDLDDPNPRETESLEKARQVLNFIDVLSSQGSQIRWTLNMIQLIEKCHVTDIKDSLSGILCSWV
jgi:hypothetical protein